MIFELLKILKTYKNYRKGEKNEVSSNKNISSHVKPLDSGKLIGYYDDCNY